MAPLPNFYCSQLCAAPKKDGTIRLILDILSSRGFLINDGTSKKSYQAHTHHLTMPLTWYVNLAAKRDVKHAFWLCPVPPNNWHLATPDYKWKDRYCFDIVLPFGDRSSPFTFSQLIRLDSALPTCHLTAAT